MRLLRDMFFQQQFAVALAVALASGLLRRTTIEHYRVGAATAKCSGRVLLAPFRSAGIRGSTSFLLNRGSGVRTQPKGASRG